MTVKCKSAFSSATPVKTVKGNLFQRD